MHGSPEALAVAQIDVSVYSLWVDRNDGWEAFLQALGS